MFVCLFSFLHLLSRQSSQLLIWCVGNLCMWFASWWWAQSLKRYGTLEVIWLWSALGSHHRGSTPQVSFEAAYVFKGNMKLTETKPPGIECILDVRHYVMYFTNIIFWFLYLLSKYSLFVQHDFATFKAHRIFLFGIKWQQRHFIKNRT